MEHGDRFHWPRSEIPAVSTFGVVLEHSPMQNVRSMEKMMAVVALTDLSLIPRRILFWEWGLLRDIEVVVHSWLEEPIPNAPVPDTTPPTSLFEEVRATNLRALTGMAPINRDDPDTVTVQFDTLFAIWESLPAGARKDELEATLRRTPHYFQREAERIRAIRGKSAVSQLESSTPDNSGTAMAQHSPLQSPVLCFTGEDAADLILRSINCDLTIPRHAAPEGDGVVHLAGHAADSTPVNPDLGMSAPGKTTFNSPLILARPEPTNWADIVDLEASEGNGATNTSLGLVVTGLGSSGPSEGKKDKLKGPVIEAGSNSNTKAQKGKRARKRAKKAVILTDLRRSARISERPPTLLRTPRSEVPTVG